MKENLCERKMQTPILSLFRLRSNASPHLRSGIFMKRIVLTGGGTAGHVTPNIALMPKLRELGYDIQYIAPTMASRRN